MLAFSADVTTVLPGTGRVRLHMATLSGSAELSLDPSNGQNARKGKTAA